MHLDRLYRLLRGQGRWQQRPRHLFHCGLLAYIIQEVFLHLLGGRNGRLSFPIFLNH